MGLFSFEGLSVERVPERPPNDDTTQKDESKPQHSKANASGGHKHKKAKGATQSVKQRKKDVATSHSPKPHSLNRRLYGPKVKTPSRSSKGQKQSSHGAQAQRSDHRSNALVALALHFKSDIFNRAKKNARIIGTVRRGRGLPVVKKVKGAGCRGDWYLVSGRGYVCSTRGFRVEKNPSPLDLFYSLPDLSRNLPYPYAKVIRMGAERLYHLPDAEEKQAIRDAATKHAKWPKVVERLMDGVFFLALHQRDPNSNSSNFYRTVRGRFVRAEDIEMFPTPAMRGEWIKSARELPIAFVFDKDRTLYHLEDGALQAVGVAEKHARFRVVKRISYKGQRFVQSKEGDLVKESEVRVTKKIKRPSSIDKKEKWIHVNLSQQTLVAYEGDKPVFVTLVSSGKKGYEPPTGFFNIVRKHVTITMDGPDPIDKWYEVQEVPWTMYYYHSYALHGTYWHNDFGTPRSHGCTNLAPLDAKWIFKWTTPKVPKGWHSKAKQGTTVYFTK